MFLQLERLEKRFGQAPVTRGVSLEVAASEIVALLGPSGSGKTTVLRLVAGFETPDAGRIVIEGQDVTRVAPERRRIGMVFQHYALFPHMSVGENVAFGLESGGVPRPERDARVAEALAAVDLAGFEPRRVTELSGGQQQRVALARALAPQPKVLLLDEPLSNLDPSLRERTRRELKRIIRRIGITTVFVTHEQEEAFDLGDRVAVLNAGRLDQVGPPEALYETPRTRFVATFVGRSSVLPGVWRGGAVEVLPGLLWSATSPEPLQPGESVDLVVRPEGVSLASEAGSSALPGRIAERRYAGSAAFYLVAVESAAEIEALAAPGLFREEDRVFVSPAPRGPTPLAFRREPE